MLPASLWLLCLTALEARARTTTTTTHRTSTTDEFPLYSASFSTLASAPSSNFAGTRYTYNSFDGQSTVEANSSSDQQQTVHTTTHSLTYIGGLTQTSNGTHTASATTSSAQPTNTVPCNNYPEFCQRKYSNITEVCAHNSAFAIPNNAGSNQIYSLVQQLNDGVRMLQGETQWVNKTVYNCHTTCDLLNAGPWEDSLSLVANWLARHPYDVVTWLIGNSNFRPVTDYVSAIQNSGIAPYLYTPDYIPQHRDQWPTLAEMILSGKRMVLFMDYNANQTEVPYILDQYTHIWETPFSPTNRSFPCTRQRPPGLGDDKAREDFMYLANHNLNTAVDLSALIGNSASGKEVILIPNTADINITNGQQDEFGQLERMRLGCTAEWNRPPNFLVVDYYNFGHPKPGSVFEVAARANGVQYNRKCCGLGESAAPHLRSSGLVIAAAVVFAALIVW